MCKIYKSLLENKQIDNLKKEIEKLKISTAARFFDKEKQNDFPKRDFYLCIELNKFDFVLKVNKDINNKLYIEKR